MLGIWICESEGANYWLGILTELRNRRVKDILISFYSAPTEEAALHELQIIEDKWGNKYQFAFKRWRNNWHNIATFSKYPEEIRHMINITNTVETVHRQFRKVTRAKTLLPNDEALIKALFLAYRDLSKKWSMAVRNWPFIVSQFDLIFGERFTKKLK